MKYFILAGEKSGDLHGSNLVKEISLIDKKAEIIGWGGDQMKSAGVEILVHHQELAIMGILGVFKNLSTIRAPHSLLNSYLIKLEFIGISIITLNSLGASFPISILSKFILFPLYCFELLQKNYFLQLIDH